MRRLPVALSVAAMAAAVGVALVVWWPDKEQDLSDLAEDLRPVSSAVDGYLNFSDVAADVDGKALLTRATEHNSKLLEPFSDFLVLVRRDGLASSVLVCDGDGERALMEDSGCTNERFDARLWEREPPPACDFQLDLKEICRVD